MNKTKLKTYSLSLILLAFLLACFFLIRVNNAIFIAIITLFFTFLIFWQIKGRTILSIYKQQVLIILAVSALLFLMLYYLSGVVFGMYRTPSRTLPQIFKKVVPIVIVAVCVEFIRYKLILQRYFWIKIIAVACCVLAEITLSYNVYSFRTFNKFMDFVGLCLFPTIVNNLLFSYIIVRYGSLPNIAYKIITSCLPIFITITPATSDALFSLFKLIFPIFIYLFIKFLYEKRKREVKRFSKIWGSLISTVLVVFASGLIMLVSCQFRFCAIVIATESMTGELNKGDMIIYEKYTEDDVISEGQIIVFDYYGATTVHRVVRIEYLNGQTRYYTKGDANDTEDYGYITDSNIYGLVHFKVPYVGYPTLLIRKIF